jgi:hypothetical protein
MRIRIKIFIYLFGRMMDVQDFYIGIDEFRGFWVKRILID